MIQTVLSDTLLHALGWTLVHSLWQAVLAALLALLFLPALYAAWFRVKKPLPDAA